MNTKGLIAVVGVLGVLAAGLWWSSGRESAGGADPDSWAGKKLLAPEVLGAATEIELAAADGSKVVLRKEGENWVLPEYFGLPADFGKLSSFTRTLLEADVDRHVTSNPERIGRLELGANTVRLLGAEGPVWELETGARGASAGQYVRIGKGESVYLTAASLYVDANEKNWARKQPLEFAEAEVARVEIALEGETVVFARESEGAEFAGVDFAENEKAKAAEVSRLVRNLVSARFADAVEAGDEDAVAARENAVPVSLELFDGRKFSLEIGRRPAAVKSAEHGNGEEVELADAGNAAAGAGAEPSGEKETVSVVFDQNGEIVPPEKIAEMTGGAGDAETAEESAEAEEVAEPGPVFVFYRSEAEGFVWDDAMERAALKFPDRIFEQLPKERGALVETVAVEVEQKE